MSRNMLSLEFENLPVRSIVDDSGETLWVAKDICDILGYANHSDVLKTHCKGVAKSYPLQTAGGIQEVRVIGESDVFKLIRRCTLPAAEKFNNWLFGEVLPSIRKTGAYVHPNAAHMDAPAVPTLYLEQSIELLQQSSEIHFRDLRGFREELDRFYDSLPQKMENICNAASAEYAAEMKGVEMLLEAADRRVQALERLVSRLEKRLDRLEDRAAA